MRLTSSFFLLFLLLQSISYSYAQNWNSNAGFLYYNQGNVGIGTTTPLSNLHIKYNGDPSAFFRIESSNSMNNASIQYVSGGVWRWESGTGISAGTAYELYDRVNGKSCLTVLQGGNIGIGTTNPLSNLHLKYDGSPFAFFRIESSSVTSNASIQYVSGGIWRWESGTGISAGTAYELYDRVNGKSCLSVLEGGNIGIGTINPTNKLDVNGTISAKEIKVTLNGWSDFVLRPSFKLRPLSEVKHYIEINGHLPEIPSEAEVMQNGVNMGDMQAKLLQKIEELTLYMIKLSEENKQLREEVNNIKINVQKK